jgi:serine/threonine-protein kinase
MTIAGSAQLPRPGDTIAGKYVLDRLLGQGGMGAVFAARHIKLSKAVAIKIMLADASNPEAAQRFINEGRAAANIQNEHVVRVDDVDEEMGYAYMVLELLDGEDLAQVLERDPAQRLASHVAVGHVIQALKGVAQAHAIGIVHRDLKPSNLFLAKRKDGSVVVKVLDFGISKAQGSSALAASPSALTSTKAMLGSPLYMSPEQLRSSKSVDHRADIWAIGVILYELITGHLPFMGESLGELFAAILETDPPPLRLRAPDVPPGVEEIVLRCLQRRPEQRFQTANELAQALAPFATPQPGIVGSPALGGTALLGQGTAAAALAGSGYVSHVTPPGAVTGPQHHPGAGMSNVPRAPMAQGVGATGSTQGGVAAAAMTPPAMQQTGGGWQSTGSASTPATKSKAPLVVGVVAGVLLSLGIAGGVLVMKNRPKSDPNGITSVAATTPLPSTAAASTSAAPPPTPTPAETPPPPTATTTATTTTTTTTTTTVKTAKPPPPKPPPDPAPQPTTKPTSKPNNGNLQNAR